jgi:hypothetical protein
MKTKMMRTMKTVLWTCVVLLALVGVVAIVRYASSHNASVTIEKTSLMTREDIKAEGPAQFTPITRVESDRLALMEDSSLMGLTAGAFNPEFAPLSDSEQDTLNSSAQQNPELQDMTAGDAGVGVGSVLLIVLILLILF